MISRKIRILTIGHSYVLALNRDRYGEVARDPDFEVTVAAPSYFHGELRDIDLEREPEDSPLRLVSLDGRWSRWIHVFHYQAATSTSFHSPEPVRLGPRLGGTVCLRWLPDRQGASQDCRSLFPFGPRKTSIRPCRRRSAPLNGRHLPGHKDGSQAAIWSTRRCGAAGYAPERGRILTLAVDTSVFRPVDDSRRSSVQRSLGLQFPVIGYSGRLTEDKGLNILMKAMEQIGGDRAWSLLLLGGGPQEQMILEWAKARGWDNRVRIVLARHDEVPSYLGAMDLLVAPSQTTGHWKEQFGRMLIEAFACGVPVIGSDSGEIPYVIGEAGRVVGEKDVTGWAAAIVDLLDRPDLRADLARKGLSRCQHFNVTTLAREYRAFYRWLAEQPVG